MVDTGKFVVSLDFELLWGVRDKRTIDEYSENIKGVWEALPKMLEAFENHKVNGTFATVGFLFAASKDELMSFIPQAKPNYSNSNLSPYNGYFEKVKDNEDIDKFHFASGLVSLILSHSGHEIASHTFSHYYCLEKGQTIDEFRSDISAAIEIAKHRDIAIKSLIFPRNQFNKEYLAVLKELGITSYRGNEKKWFYSAARGEEESLIKRAFRLLDSYVNIAGHNSYSIESLKQEEPFNIPSSRFLRPYSKKLKWFEKLRLRRVLKSMTYAAKNNQVFHLWWHPHNFGKNQSENLAFLNNILDHYLDLRSKYGFESLTMNELALLLKKYDTKNYNAYGRK